MKSDFEERKEKRIEGFKRKAAKANQESQAAFRRSDDLVKHIPPGQPILVGHHSEKRHRNTLDKSHQAMGKGIELQNKSKYYEQRVKSAEANKAIFSDDPNVVEKLAEKIERLEKRQELMKQANKLIRKNDVEGLLNLGFSESAVNQLFKPDFCGRIGFADYNLTNNSANIRRLKQRLELEKQKESLETKEVKVGEVKLVANTEDNRTQIFFPGKPSDQIIKLLKGYGFRWAPSVGAWQRHLSGLANHRAKEIAEKYNQV